MLGWLEQGLVCFQPVSSPACVGHEGYGECIGMFHLFHDNAFDKRFLFGIDREIELIMYLQDHFRPDAFLSEAAVDADHLPL